VRGPFVQVRAVAVVPATALLNQPADVVREEAGGVRLETLLIDEGFGSLDETDNG
jgi:hypothetical protein